ncbi:MAG: serine hydrolase, partial [Flavisolibacter sp.]
YLVIFISTLSFSQETITDKRLASLDTAFERALKTWKTAGFAVAVVEKNKIIYAKGFGYRDFEKKIPVTPSTLFAIGSCTKAFTASLLGILQKDGKLDIDKPAQQYLPDLNFYTPELTSQVTLRDMMSHRTGLPRHDISWYLFSTGNRDSLYRRIQFQQPTQPLRKLWQYNNFMFVAQGSVAEKITGKTWEENIKEKILVPLKMHQTVFTVQDMARHANAAKGYALKKDSLIYKVPYYNINAAGPAGSINSSVLEMSNWVITWINGGKFNGQEILPSAYVIDAMSSQTVVIGAPPSKEKPDIHFTNYGLGWSLSSYKGHYRVDHGGNIDGFSANTSFFPTESIGIIVLTNQDRSSIPSIVRNLVADRLLNEKYFDWNTDLRLAFEKTKKQTEESLKTKTDPRKKGTKPSHPLKDYEGLYTHPGYGTFDIFEKDDSLFAYTSSHTVWLRHYHYDIFTPYLLEDMSYDTTEANIFSIEFNTGVSGDIESLNPIGFEAPTIQLLFQKTPKAKAVSKNELEKYAGNYTVAGTDAKFYLTGGTLRLLVTGQPEYELIPTGNDKFSIKNLNGYSIQFINKDGKFTAIDFIQPNGTFRAERK